MKRAIDRIPVINNGRFHPAREQQPHAVSCGETFHCDTSEVCVCDRASYRSVLLQSRLSLFLVFGGFDSSIFFCCLRFTANTIELAIISKSQGFIRWEQKQFRNLLLMDSFEDKRLTFRNIRHTLDNICFMNEHLFFLQSRWIIGVSLKPKSGSDKPVWAGGFPECSLTH